MTDSHNVGRDRGGLKSALSKVEAATLCIGIRSDLLFPVDELKLVAGTVPDGRYAEIDSDFGHDGFLIESEKLSSLVREFAGTKNLVLQ